MTEARADKAIIFDMDGVISDTQRLHSESEVEALARFGITCVAHELTIRYSGVSDREMFLDILEDHGVSPTVVNDVEELKWRILHKKVEQGIPLIPNIERLIGEALACGYRLAVASGAPLHFIHQVVSHPLLRDSFEVVVSSEEVLRGKPAPDVFLEAASRLSMKAQDCLVIEDGYNGLVGARSAGMRCIGIVTDINNAWPADLLVHSVDDISMESIAALLHQSPR